MEPVKAISAGRGEVTAMVVVSRSSNREVLTLWASAWEMASLIM